MDNFDEKTKKYRIKNRTQSHQLKEGTLLLERYRIEGVIGQGGFGITYFGYDTRLNIDIAIKEYYPTGYAQRSTEITNEVTIINEGQIEFIKNGMDKFLSEAKVLAKFHNYPGIVSVRDFFEENGTAYIIMELLQGVDLKHRIKEELYSAEEIFTVLEPVFDALIKVHSLGIIHRDISPDNILIMDDGSAKLMDFGAARIINADTQKSISVVLKSGFAPVEQYRTRGIQGPWTDIYALCATIYKCITGVTPIDSLERMQEDELKKPSQLGAQISSHLEKVLMKGLSVKASDRFQNVDDFKKAIHGELKGFTESDENIEDTEDDDEDVTVSLSKDREIEAESINEPNAGEVKKRNNKLIITAAAVVVVLLCVFAIFNRFNKGKESAVEAAYVQSASATAENNAKENSSASDEIADVTTTVDNNADSHSDMYEVIITPDSNITVSDFSKECEAIKNRISAIICTDDFEYVVDGMKIRTYLPKSLFISQSDMAHLLKWYVTSAINLRGKYYCEAKGINDDYYDIGEITKSTKIVKGKIPDLDVDEIIESDYVNYNGEDYTYMQVEFSDEFWGEYGESIKSGEASFDFYSTISYSDGYTFDSYEGIVVSDGVMGFYYAGSIERELMGGNPSEIMGLIYNLNNGVPNSSFLVYSPWVDINWESTEKASDMGVNQCDIEELDNNYITLEFETNSNISEGKLLDLITGLKRRLDSIGTQYAIGYNVMHIGRDNQQASGNKIYIAYDPYYAGNFIIENIRASHTNNYGVYGPDSSIYLKGSKASYINDGNPRIEVIFEKEKMQELEYLTRYLIEKGQDLLYFTLFDGRYRYVAKKKISEPITDGVVVFDELLYETDGQWLWNFVGAVMEEDNVLFASGASVRFDFIDYQFAMDDDGNPQEHMELGVKSLLNSKELEDELKREVCSSATVSTDSDTLCSFDFSSITIDLNIEVDDDFAANAVVMTQKTLEIINSKKYPNLSVLHINLATLDNITKEKAEVTYRTYTSFSYDGDRADTISFEDYSETVDQLLAQNNAKHGVYFEMKNGRFEKYQEEIKKLLKDNTELNQYSVYFNGGKI